MKMVSWRYMPIFYNTIYVGKHSSEACLKSSEGKSAVRSN